MSSLNPTFHIVRGTGLRGIEARFGADRLSAGSSALAGGLGGTCAPGRDVDAEWAARIVPQRVEDRALQLGQ